MWDPAPSCWGPTPVFSCRPIRHSWPMPSHNFWEIPRHAHAWARRVDSGSRPAFRWSSKWRACRRSIARRPRLAERQDYLLVYAPPWSGPTRFSKHHLACHLAAKGGRVLYVEAPLTPVGLRRGRGFFNELAKTFQPPRRVDTTLWVRRHFVP